MGGTSAVITVVGATVGLRSGGRRVSVSAGELWSTANRLPDAVVAPAAGTRDEFTPLEEHYRIDINTTTPRLDRTSWRLITGGLVRQPRSFDLEAIRAFEPQHLFVTLSCISNPVAGDLISTTRWTGVSLQRFLPELQLMPAASHLHIHSADGFDEVLPLDQALSDSRVMLTYAGDGVPLLPRHGYPLRLYIPDRSGMKQPKWI
jgi:DMSO/TMAO reductase YedYZ molybdopterin-dependent catalytic subunit